tara:strand:+ start:379 stop:1248 length:870 start_codon:yes stop_codon:yes gene_type:complete
MGLGGYLTWAAAAREIYETYGVKMIPIEVHMGQSAAGDKIPLTRLVKSESFKNNPYVCQEFDGEHGLQVRLNGSSANYVEEEDFLKVVHKSDKHIIETICETVGIKNPTIKCDIFLDEKEEEKVEKILSTLPEKFITIEPHSNLEFTVNRSYPFEKWQSIVNDVLEKTDHKVVQIGTGPSLLKNVIDLRGKTSFREASAIIEASSCLVSTEGGLTHLATCTETTAVVVLTGYQAQKMVEYPSNVYVNISKHGPCGMKVSCPKCLKDAKEHDYKEVVNKVLSVIGEKEWA